MPMSRFRSRGHRTPYEILARSVSGRVLFDEPMARHTTYRIGGPADLYVEPRGLDDLKTVIRFLHEYHAFGLWLGAGSKLLISDQGVRGVVIRLNRCCNQMRVEGRLLRAGAAVSLGRLVRRAEEEGLGGIVFLSGIPGTVGGAVQMNAGAFGGELGNRVSEVEVMTRTGEHGWLQSRGLTFRYREVEGIGDSLVLSARLLLDRTDPDLLFGERNRLLKLRGEKHPAERRSCGSVFKRVPGNPPPGELIEKAGCKGLRQGGAEVSRTHANFIVNIGGATGDDVWGLLQEVRRRVVDRFGLILPLEVQPVGVFPEDSLS
jgi:UDP-N-acetylmuramate dehydrogenase